MQQAGQGSHTFKFDLDQCPSKKQQLASPLAIWNWVSNTFNHIYVHINVVINTFTQVLGDKDFSGLFLSPSYLVLSYNLLLWWSKLLDDSS